MKKLVAISLLLAFQIVVLRSITILTSANVSVSDEKQQSEWRLSPTNLQINDSIEKNTVFQVQINGENNLVEINGKKVQTTSDTLQTKNKVQVSGENNSIKINQTNQKSEVIILQKGGNNKVSISQTN